MLPRDQITVLLRQSRLAEALALSEQVVEASPGDPQTWLAAACAFGQAEDFEQARNAALRALSFDPDYLHAHFMAGLAAAELEQIDQAIAHLNVVLAKEPEHGRAHGAMGQALFNARRFEDAKKSFRKALSLIPGDTVLRTMLAVTCEKSNEVEEARSLIEPVLAADPDHPMANIVAARIEKREKKYAEAIARLNRLVTLPVPYDRKMRAYNLLALVYDRAGDYEASWTAQVQSQLMARKKAGDSVYDRFWFQRTQLCQAGLTESRVAGWKPYPCDDDIPAPMFLVGFPRSGTTLTEQIVSTHSDVVPSDERGMVARLSEQIAKLSHGHRGYPFGLEHLTNGDIRRLRKLYWSYAREMVSAPLDGKRLLDKLPMNIIDLGLIHRVFPEAKVLVLLRDPRDVCLSAYMQLFTLNDAMQNFLDLESGARFYDATMGLWLHYRSVFDKLHYLEVRYEDIVEDFEANARRIIDFFGLDWEEQILEYHNANKRYIGTPSYQDVSTPVYKRSAGRWLNYARHIKPVIPVLEPYIREFGYSMDADT